MGLSNAFVFAVCVASVAVVQASAEGTAQYDEQNGCALIAPAPNLRAGVLWSGDCHHGYANGHGIAAFLNGPRFEADFRDGRLLDGNADIHFADGAHYAGEIVEGLPQGAGVLVSANGDRFEGSWKGGHLDGHGTVSWANGDRYDGDWIDGKADGHGIQVWANGQRYDGSWRNDLPDGQGILTAKDGTQQTVSYVAGKRQPATPVALVASQPRPSPPAQSAAPDRAAASPQTLLQIYSDQSLHAIDGSSISFKSVDDGVLRTLAAPDGKTQTVVFHRPDETMGAIADADRSTHVVGYYRVGDKGIDAQFADGQSEHLSALDGGGLALTINGPTGGEACMRWYPDGHVFSAADRKAAVADYARKLGVSTAPPITCAAATPITPVTLHHNHTQPHATVAALTPVLVKDSQVHLIDEAAAGVAMPPVDEANASSCLRVDSADGYLGFRNHCAYSVQFAYCLLNGTDALTSCDQQGSVPGSVPAASFGALFADQSLAERDFRWIGCRGGAGEVVARLETAEPASGRCMRGQFARQAAN